MPGRLSRLSIWLQPKSWSHGPWVWDFASGHDLMVCGFEPHIELCADSSEPGACFCFCVFLSLCPTPTPTFTLCLSLSLKNKQMLKKNYFLTNKQDPVKVFAFGCYFSSVYVKKSFLFFVFFPMTLTDLKAGPVVLWKVLYSEFIWLFLNTVV